MMNGISIFLPNSLPAEVTYVELLDTDGIYYSSELWIALSLSQQQ